MDISTIRPALTLMSEKFQSDTEYDLPEHLAEMVEHPEKHHLIPNGNTLTVQFPAEIFYLHEGGVDDTFFDLTITPSPQILISDRYQFDSESASSAEANFLMYATTINYDNNTYFCQIVSAYVGCDGNEDHNEITAIYVIKNPTIKQIKEMVKSGVKEGLYQMRFAQNFCTDLMAKALDSGMFERTDFDLSQNAFHRIIATAETPDPFTYALGDEITLIEQNLAENYDIVSTQTATLLVDRYNSANTRKLDSQAHDNLRIAFQESGFLKSKQTLMKLPLADLITELQPKQITIPPVAKPSI